MRRSVLSLTVLLLLSSGNLARAITLFDNGPITDLDSSGSCDQGPTGCGGTGTWTVYDNFVIAGDAVMNGFDYTDWFSDGSGPANYVQTNWSLFDASPHSSPPIASGTATAVLTPTGPVDQFMFSLSILPIGLAGGVEYWLGINNLVTDDIITTFATVDDPGGVLSAVKQGDSETDVFDLHPSYSNRAFRIHGVPEPSSASMLLIGLVALAVRRTGAAQR